MKAVGPASAPYLFVMSYKPSPGMEAWFWRTLHKAGILKSRVRIVYMLDEPPAGTGNKPLKSQVRSSRERFEEEVRRSRPKVVVPLGTEPFQALTGINESIMDARGYLIRKRLFRPVAHEVYKQVGTYKNASKSTGAKKGDPKMKWVKELQPCLLGEDFAGVVIPSFTLDHIRTEGFAVAPAFIVDMQRVKRAHDDALCEVGRELKYHSTIDTLPPADSLSELVAVDIETHGIDNEVIDLVSFSDGTTTAAIDWSEGARLYVEKLFRDPSRLFAVHNSPFDIPRLRANGVQITDEVVDTQVFDTMFGAVQVQPDLHKALGRVASVYLDLEPWKTSSRAKASHWRAMVESDPRLYSAKDSFFTYWIARQLIAVMKDLGAWKYFMGRDGHPGPGVMATIPELTAMSRGGLRIDRDEAARMEHRGERRLLRYMKLWSRMFPDVSPTSTHQLQSLFYTKWKLPVQGRTTQDSLSADELTLVKLQALVRDHRDDEYLSGPWQQDARAVPRTFDLLLSIRSTAKALSTYVKPAILSAETWVHPSYLPVSKDDEGRRGGKKISNKGTTATGRLASYGPNIHNQPKKLRVLYAPDTSKMCFVQADYKSAELYVLAGASGDKKLLSDLSGDMHQENADRLGVSRKVAKNVTYASQYLAGPAKQSEMILEQEHLYVSPAECLAISSGIWGYYTDATAYKQMLVSLCAERGYITNAFGRTRFFHAGQAPAAVDFIPQSTVADILWCVLKPVAQMARSLGGRLVTTVHDSVLVCVPKKNRVKAARQMKKIMERKFDCVAPGFYIPVEIEMGEPGASWGSLKKWEGK